MLDRVRVLAKRLHVERENKRPWMFEGVKGLKIVKMLLVEDMWMLYEMMEARHKEEREKKQGNSITLHEEEEEKERNERWGGGVQIVEIAGSEMKSLKVNEDITMC